MDVFLKGRRVSDVKNRQLAARLRLRETLKRIARLDRVVYRGDCDRGRQAPRHESAQTDEVRGDGLSRAAPGYRGMLHGIGVHRQLLELRVAMISDSSGTDALIDSPASRRPANIRVRWAVGVGNERAAPDAGDEIFPEALIPGLNGDLRVAHAPHVISAREQGQIVPLVLPSSPGEPLNPKALAPTMPLHARVAELADARDLGSRGETLEGSSPSSRIPSLRACAGSAPCGRTGGRLGRMRPRPPA